MKGSRILSQLKPPEYHGHLVNPNSPLVRIIKNRPAADATPSLLNFQDRGKFDQLTIEARSPNPGMDRIPNHISSAINNMTKGLSAQSLRQRVAELYGSLGKGAGHEPALEREDVEAQITGLFVQNYISIVHALREIKTRRPDFRPRSVLDIGFGPATGLLACREVFGESNCIESEMAVVIGHSRMRSRAKEMLGENSSLKFSYEVPSSSSPKRYDLIIALNQLYQPGKYNQELADSHSQQLAQICDDSGVVLFVERGDPLGFEAIALAREHLLRPKYKMDIVGPCTHKTSCPLQAGLNVRSGLKDAGKLNWCRFSQNIERPRFTRELKKGQYLSQAWLPNSVRGAGGTNLKGTGRPGGSNNEQARFSWVALEKGRSTTATDVPSLEARPSSDVDPSTGGDSATTRNSNSSRWPRIMKTPLKRQGHVLMEVCSPSGNIEHWTVPRSQGKQAYHDARKSSAADLWALDAKVKQTRGGLHNLDLLKSKVSVDSTQEPCKDWWLPSSNPHYKFSSHQARKRVQDMAEPEYDSFLSAMDSLIEDEGRESKLMKKRVQRRYR